LIAIKKVKSHKIESDGATAFGRNEELDAHHATRMLGVDKRERNTEIAQSDRPVEEHSI